MQISVRIVNRQGGNAYTSQRKALNLYVARGLAEVVKTTDNGYIREIRMLDSAELALARSRVPRQRSYDPVTGKFEWMVGDSGGSRLMKSYTGISGGERVLQAQHKA